MLDGDHDPKIIQILTTAKTAYQDFVDTWEQRTDYLTNPAILKRALDDYEALARDHAGSGSAGYYFWLRSHQDQSDPKIKAQTNKIHELETKLVNEVEFFTNRLSKISLASQKLMLSALELKPYHHFLERLFTTGKYVLSEPEEKILNLMSQTSFENWVNMVQEFISKEKREVLDESGQKVLKPMSDFISLLNSQKKEVRDVSAGAMNDVLAKHSDSAEHELNSILLDKKLDDELRGFERPDKARHINDDIDTEVVDALVDTISSRFELSARYYALKARLLKVPKLAYHERNVNLGSLNRKYSYEKAVDMVETTFNDLDPDFGRILRTMVDKGRIDVFPAKGKSNGAFCMHKRPSDPTYILLNHTNKLNDVLTLGHEMGHAVNNILIARVQNALNYDTPLSTAEVASTFMEDFVFDRAQAEYDPSDRLYLLMEKLNDDVSTIFRQVACYKFEQELHNTYREKSYLTKEEIGALFTKHMAAYMGDAVEQSPGSQNWWVYWSHIRSFFYVYSYASGLLISKSLQSMLRREKSSIVKVKKFLSAGVSESPKKLFFDMGIDISNAKFWNRGLDAVELLLNQAESLA